MLFQSNHRKVAVALENNVIAFIARFGIENVAFFTLTFADDVREPKVASARFRSLRAHVIVPRYRHYIRVFERCVSGRIHFHLVVHVGADVRSGVDLVAFRRRDYRSAPEALRREWAFWRATAPAYGFGRCEMLPIKSTAGAVGCYLGKYIAKHIAQRELRDKRVRLVDYGRTSREWTSRFAFAEGKAAKWRANLATFAEVHAVPQYEALRVRFGRRWAYFLRDAVVAIDPGDARMRYPVVRRFPGPPDRPPFISGRVRSPREFLSDEFASHVRTSYGLRV